MRHGEPDLQTIALSEAVSLSKALSLIEATMQPAPMPMLEEGLAIVATLTSRFSRDDADADIQLMAYTTKLREYPADVALQALREAPDRSSKWPAWADLKGRMDFLVRKRREMYAAVQWAADGREFD